MADPDRSRLVRVVGADAPWGRAVVQVLTEQRPEVRIEELPATVDPCAEVSLGALPDVVVLACDDPGATALASCLERGVAVVDLAWSLADVDVAGDRIATYDDPARVLAPVGWAGSAGAIVLAAAVATRAGQGARALHVDVDVLLTAGDRADDWWWRRFANLHRTFVVWDRGGRRLARGLGEPKTVRFSDGRARRARRIDSPEQDTIVEAGLADSASVRVAFERRGTDLWLAALIGSGAWRFLPASWRRAVLEPRRTSTPAPHELVVTAAYPDRVLQAKVVDPAGRAHLVAACAVTQVVRLLDGDDPLERAARRGVAHPESAPDVARDLALLRTLGVVVEVTQVAGVSPESR